MFLFLVPAGRRAPGNQSGRAKEGGGQSLLGKAVQEKIGKLRSGGTFSVEFGTKC